MEKSNSEKFNECNPRSDSYCIFEQKIDKLDKIINSDVGWVNPKVLIDTIKREVLN